MSQETAPGYIDSSSGKSYDTFLSGKVHVPGMTPVTPEGIAGNCSLLCEQVFIHLLALRSGILVPI